MFKGKKIEKEILRNLENQVLEIKENLSKKQEQGSRELFIKISNIESQIELLKTIRG